MPDTNNKDSLKPFFELIYKKFRLLEKKEDTHFHYWYGDKNKVIQLFQGMSFPSVLTLQQMGKVKEDKLLVLSASNISKNLFYGATILKIKSKNEAELISFVVHPEFRNLGFGTHLMEATFAMSKMLKIQSIFLKYRTYWKSNQHWELLLEKTGWSNPELQLWYFTLPDINTLFHKEWVKQSRIDAPYSIEEWNNECMDKLKKTLSEEDWKGRVPRALSPFQMPALILPHVSLLLKKDEEVVGWLICHLLQEDIVQATTVYVHPEKAKGQGLNLMAEVANRRKLGAQVIFMVEKHNKVMLNLVNKHFSGGKTNQYELRTRVKQIN
jgi:N-acetylglutamate synthase-like GNAT family acetyltransferase